MTSLRSHRMPLASCIIYLHPLPIKFNTATFIIFRNVSLKIYKTYKIYKVQGSKYRFVIQLDKTTGAQLLAFVLYATKDSIQSELLLSNEMRTTTKEEDVFKLVDNFFKENGLQWSKPEGCTTDGPPAMLGRKSGFQACVKAVFLSVISVHCFIQRFALAAKLLPLNLKTSLNPIVKMVNYEVH